MSWLAQSLQTLTGPPAKERARSWQARTGDGLWLGAGGLRKLQGECGVRPGPGIVTLGSLVGYPGEPVWIGLPVSEFSRLHGSIQGASGAGKSFLALGVLMTLIQSGQPVILFDMKHETADLLLNAVLPALAASPEGRRIASRVRVIRPFDPDFVPPLRVTTPEEGVSREVQALSMLTSLEEASREAFPARMTRCTLVRLILAIERNEPLPILTEWLTNPAAFARDAHQSSDPTVREYVRNELAREPTSSLSAVTARLQNFLFLPAVRAALSTESCVSFPEMFARDVTVFDFGNPPAGQERAAKLWAVLCLGRLVRAALNRDVREATPAVTIVADEIQEALTPDAAEMLQRMMSLARYRRVHLITVNQAGSQLASAAPEFQSALRTSAGFCAIFRSSPEDARAVAPAFPTASEGADEGNAHTRMAREITRLKNREYVLWLRQSGLAAVKLRSPLLDMEDLRRRADRCPAGLRERIIRGSVAVRRSEVGSHPARPSLTLCELDDPPITTGQDERFPRLG